MSSDSKNSQFFEEIIALLPGHIYWKNKDGVLLGCNDEQARYIGLKSRKEIVGLTAFDTLPKDIAEIVTKNDMEVMQTGQAQQSEEVVSHSDGKKSTWLSKKVPLIDEHNNIIGLLGISVEITAEKERDLLKFQKQSLEKQLESAKILGAAIAHELRTPLLTISTNAKLIEMDLEDDEDKSVIEHHVKRIKNEVIKSNESINIMLMNISMPEGSALESIDINSCILEAIERFPYSDRDDKALIHQNVSENFEFKGDRTLMIHILFNLIKNSLYFIKKAGKGKIFISISSEASHNVLSFKDTGCGVSPSEKEQIFKEFYTTTSVGTGVGLSFCKLTIEKFGGSITCESVEGEYIDFIIKLPKIKVEESTQ